MRLWHYLLIPHLPDRKTSGHKKLNQLGGQHNECAAMRGKGWGTNHSVVNYVWQHNYQTLYNYHVLIMKELWHRGFIIADDWWNLCYRGRKLGYCFFNTFRDLPLFPNDDRIIFPFYPEHDEKYLDECIDNLANKGIIIDKIKLLKRKSREKVVSYDWDLINRRRK